MLPLSIFSKFSESILSNMVLYKLYTDNNELGEYKVHHQFNVLKWRIIIFNHYVGLTLQTK